MSLNFYVVREAEGDLITATDLADRVIVEAIHWLCSDTLEYHRSWHGTNSRGDQLTWKRIKQLAKDEDIEDRGFFDGEDGYEVGYEDARAARRAIAYLHKVADGISGIMLVRDQDNNPNKAKGLEQARVEHVRSSSNSVVVIGLAVVEREAWVLSGFVPEDEHEQSLLESERKRLVFNPCEKSHELTAPRAETDKRSPKLRCWATTPLEVLRQRGTLNGLTLFLDEVRTRLAPLIGHVPGRTTS